MNCRRELKARERACLDCGSKMLLRANSLREIAREES